MAGGTADHAHGVLDLSDWRVIVVGLLGVWMFVAFTHFTIVEGRAKTRRRAKFLKPVENKVE